MKTQIRNTALLALTTFALSACAATTVVDKPVSHAVKSVRTSTSNGTVPPKHQRAYNTTLGSDLKATKIVKGYEGKVLSSTSIKITQMQFDNLFKDLDFAQLRIKPPASRPLPPGSSRKSVSIETTDGTYQFDNGGHYPDAIRRLSADIDQLFGP